MICCAYDLVKSLAAQFGRQKIGDGYIAQKKLSVDVRLERVTVNESRSRVIANQKPGLVHVTDYAPSGVHAPHSPADVQSGPK